MSKKLFHCHIDNIDLPLPKYLNAHSKHKSNPEKYAGRWRYRAETGKAPQDITKYLTGDVPDRIGLLTVIEMVKELNKKYHPEEAESTPTTIAKGSLLRQFNKFKVDYEGSSNQNWKDKESLCTRFCTELEAVPVRELDKQMLQDALSTFKPHAQAKLKKPMTVFFDEHIFDYDLCPKILANPFVSHNRYSLKFKDKKTAKTNRMRLLKSDVRSMISSAEANGEQWLVEALQISFLLGLRCADVVNMKWADYRPKQGQIVINIAKSQNTLGKERGVRLLITKQSHPEVMQILRDRYLKRGIVLKPARKRHGIEIERAIVETADYVFYRKPQRVLNRKQKSKTQETQIGSGYYSRRFKFHRDNCPAITERMEAENGYTCLHEVRSLFARLAYVKGDKKNAEAVRDALAHQKKEKGALENHYLDNGQTITPELLITLDDLNGPEIDDIFQDFGEIEEAIGEAEGA